MGWWISACWGMLQDVGDGVSPKPGALSSSCASIIPASGGAALIPPGCHKLGWPHPVPSGLGWAWAGDGPGVRGGSRDKTRLCRQHHPPGWDSSAAWVTSAVTSSAPTAPGPEGRRTREKGLVVPRCPQKMCDTGVPEPTQQGEGRAAGASPKHPTQGGKLRPGAPPRQAEPPSRSSGAEEQRGGQGHPPPPSRPSSPGSAADSRLHTGTAAGTAAREATKMI